MSNKNFKPATDKSSAVGKNNFKQKKDIDKYGMKIAAERDKKIKQQEKRSAEIKKQRQKQTEIETKQKQKADNKQQRQEKHQSNISAFKKFLNRVKYIFSFEFLMTVNFKRVFLFIVLPLVVIVSIIVIIANSVFANVPLSIRSFNYNGRIESENIAAESVYNNKQKEIFVDTLNSKGSKKVKFYINSVIEIDDNNETQNLIFGNLSGDNTVLIATIYDKNGNVLYRSLGLENNKEINKIKFFRELSYGTHKVKVAVTAYDKEKNEKIGTKFANIQLNVK